MYSHTSAINFQCENKQEKYPKQEKKECKTACCQVLPFARDLNLILRSDKGKEFWAEEVVCASSVACIKKCNKYLNYYIHMLHFPGQNFPLSTLYSIVNYLHSFNFSLHFFAQYYYIFFVFKHHPRTLKMCNM